MKRTLLSLLVVALFSSLVCAAEPVGWRTDGTGRYPKASPPLEWSEETNIVWKTPMLKGSFGSPILVGDRLFVTSEPTELICVRARDGEILWSRSHDYAAALGEEKGKAIEADLAKAKELDKERRELQRARSEQRKKDKNDKPALEKIEAQIDALEKRIAELRKYPGVGRGSLPGSRGTPTSDGESVFVSFGNGVVAAYSLDGKRRWIRFVAAPKLGFGQATSPLLVAGQLIVHFDDMVALDPTTGKERWRAEVSASYGSPIRTKVGEVEVIVSPSGSILRAHDGKVLVEKLPRLPESSPIVQDGVLYMMSNGRNKATALRLSPSGGGSVTTEVLWTTEVARSRRFASWAYHDGLLYGFANNYLEVFDATNGKEVYRNRLPLRGKSYSSVAVAGGRVYLSGDRGRTVALRPGKKYEQLAMNELESVGSCLLFVGDRIYLRGYKNLYCISATK